MEADRISGDLEVLESAEDLPASKKANSITPGTRMDISVDDGIKSAEQDTKGSCVDYNSNGNQKAVDEKKPVNKLQHAKLLIAKIDMHRLAGSFLLIAHRHALAAAVCVFFSLLLFAAVRVASWHYAYLYAEAESRAAFISLHRNKVVEDYDYSAQKPSTYMLIDDNDSIRISHDPGFRKPWMYAIRNDFSFFNGVERSGVKAVLNGSPYITDLFDKEKHDNAWSLFVHLLLLGEYNTHHEAVKILIKSAKETVKIDERERTTVLSDTLPYFNGVLWHIEYYLLAPALEMFNKHEYGRASTFIHMAAKILSLFDIPTEIEAETQWRINKIYLLKAVLSEPLSIFAAPEEAAIIVQSIISGLPLKSFDRINESISSPYLENQKRYLMGVHYFREGKYDEAYKHFAASSKSKSTHMSELSNLMKARCLYWLIVIEKESPMTLKRSGMKEELVNYLMPNHREQALRVFSLLGSSKNPSQGTGYKQKLRSGNVEYKSFVGELKVIHDAMRSKNFQSDVAIYIKRASDLMKGM